MASETSVETQGYFRYGFGSFKPHQLILAKKGRRQRRHEVAATGSHNRAITLPSIHVSKLKEKPPRKLTKSLKTLQELPSKDDCSFCQDKTKKRMLPSLAATCILPKLKGKVYHDSSWWEWCEREARIRQTKLGIQESYQSDGSILDLTSGM